MDNKYIHFVIDTQYHYYQYRTESLYYHLKNNPHCNIETINVPYVMKHETKAPLVYEFFIDDLDQGELSCITNKFPIKHILNDNKSVVIINTLYKDLSYIEPFYRNVIKKNPLLKEKLYLHSKLFFPDNKKLPIISTAVLPEKPLSENTERKSLVGLTGNPSNSTYIAAKSFAYHYDVTSNLACKNSLYDNELNTALKWKYQPSWFDDEKGFRSFIFKSIPFNFENHVQSYRYEMYCTEIKSNKATDISLSEITTPSIWANKGIKDHIVNSAEYLKNCSVTFNDNEQHGDNRVTSFREEFRQLRILSSLKENEYSDLYTQLDNAAARNLEHIKNNNGFLFNETYSIIKSLCSDKMSQFPSVKGLSHHNVAAIDYNDTNKKSLIIVQEDDVFNEKDFLASVPSIKILTIEFKDEDRFVESVANLRKHLSKNDIIYFHGDIQLSPRTVNTVSSLVNKGHAVFSNKHIKNPHVQRIVPSSKSGIIEWLIKHTTNNNIYSIKNNISDDIKSESHLTETDILNRLEKNEWFVPISDITNGMGITEYMDSNNISYIPVYCGIIIENDMINQYGYELAKKTFGNQLQLFVLNCEQFLLQAIKKYPFAYTFYDACIFWMIENTNKTNFVVSLDNYKRMLSYHHLSKGMSEQCMYQHQFPASNTKLKDYDDVSIALHYETQVIEEIYEKFYRRY